MRYHSYLNSASKIIDTYRGDVPFAIFIKKYFSANKKYGSKDRKQISTLCYNFFRLGKAVPGLPVAEKIIVACFLGEQAHSEFLQFHKLQWNEQVTKPYAEKLAIAGIKSTDIFPFANELSPGIGFEPFTRSFGIQPELFLRIRPGRKATVVKQLEAAGLQLNWKGDDTITLPNSTKLDGVIDTDKDAVIQDYNSQQVLNFIKQDKTTLAKPVTVWDCCAASGGKSILAYDILQGDVELTVSDIRESILSNLKKRFGSAGIRNYKSFVADLSGDSSPLPAASSQLVICDAPCTGSGTWSRTPEQLYYFKQRTIDDYARLQQQIVTRVIPHLPPDGIFIYITCSVFKKENEEMVAFIKEKFHLQLLQMEFLKGYDKKADSMFVAVFKK